MSAVLKEAPPTEQTGSQNAVIVLPNLSDEKGKSLLQQAETVTITDQQTYDVMAEVFKGACEFEKVITADFSDPKDRAHKLHKSICDLEKKYLTPVLRAKDISSCSIGAWDELQEQKRLDEQRRLEEEARRREEEERIETAVEIEEAGASEEEVDAVLSTPAPAMKVQAAPTYVRAAGVGVQYNYSARLVNIDVLIKAVIDNPTAFRGYLLANLQAANALARTQKEAFSLPGFELLKEPKGTNRSRS